MSFLFSRLPRLSRMSKGLSRHTSRLAVLDDVRSEAHSTEGSLTPTSDRKSDRKEERPREERKDRMRPRSSSYSAADRIRLPPIKEGSKFKSSNALYYVNHGKNIKIVFRFKRIF